MRLYLIRHGVTDWNNEKRLQGKSDIPLNAFGELLAKETGEALRDIPFDLAYTSPLIRRFGIRIFFIFSMLRNCTSRRKGESPLKNCYKGQDRF